MSQLTAQPITFWGISMKEQIEAVFNALKELDIKATPHNVSILDGVYDILREIYNGGNDNAGNPE